MIIISRLNDIVHYKNKESKVLLNCVDLIIYDNHISKIEI